MTAGERTAFQPGDIEEIAARTVAATGLLLVTGTFNVARPTGSPEPGVTVIAPICTPESTVIGTTSVRSYFVAPAV